MEIDTVPSVASVAGTIDGWLSQEELGARWKVSKQTIRRLRKSGKLPTFQITKALYRFKLEDILRLEAEGAMVPTISAAARKPSNGVARTKASKKRAKG